MENFTDRLILIMPKEETTNRFSEFEERRFNRAVENIIRYFDSIGIETYCFSTDDVAIGLKHLGMKFIHSILPEDRFYLDKAVKDETAYIKDAEELPSEIYDAVRKKYPVPRGLSVDDRYDLTVKRDRLSGNIFLKDFRFIITMDNKSNAYYRVESTKKKGDMRNQSNGDKRIVVRIDYNTFMCSATLSNVPIDISYIFQDEELLKPVNEWEIKEED